MTFEYDAEFAKLLQGIWQVFTTWKVNKKELDVFVKTFKVKPSDETLQPSDVTLQST